MEKILLEEINRVREIMGLKLISEAVGPKPRTVGGILLNALINGAGKLKPQNVAKKIESQLSASGDKNAKKTADLIKSLADDVKENISKSQDFEAALVKYLDPLELNFLVRNIGRNSTEVLDNYITATVMFDNKIYNEFADMVSKGEKLADERIKDYIARTALANPNLYDVPTLERMWSDIESGQFKYADEAGISVPGRKTKPEEPGFKVDAEGIKDTEGPKIGDDIPKEKAEIIIGGSDDEVVENAAEIAKTEITKYLENDLRFKGASVETKNKIIEQIQKNIREKYPKEFNKFEELGKQVEEIAEAAWKQKVKPSDKVALIEKSFKELAIKFQFNIDNLYRAVLNDLTLKDPVTGDPIWNSKTSIGKRFSNYLLMNSIVLGIESAIDYIDYQNENPDKWGDDVFERLNNFYNPAKILRVFIPLPSVYTAILSKLIGTGFITPDRRPPAKDELIKNPSLKDAFGSTEGNIITGLASTSPDMDGKTDNDDFAVYVSDNQGKNYGLWTYNTDTKQVEKYKDPVENAATLSTPSITGNYEAKLDSFKQWIKDKGKTDRGTRGPDSNGIFQNGTIDYEFVDPNTGFKPTNKEYKP
jgi:hypothetical protein